MARASAQRKNRKKSEAKAGKNGAGPSPQVATAVNKLLFKGSRLQKKGDHKAASQLYLKAFNMDPANPQALELLGQTLHRLGKRSLAIEMFERALEHAQDDRNIYISLGNMSLEMGFAELSLKFSQLLMAIHPDFHVGYNNAATALRDLERYDEGIAIIQSAISMFPDTAELWNTLATLVTARDGLEASLVFYEEAMRLAPRMTKTISNLARSYDRLGQSDKAIELCERALKTDPGFIEAKYIIGSACLATGDLKRGWENYEARLHSGRSDATLYTHGVPKWDGCDLNGKRLLISPEQGVGDEIMFASCIPEVFEQADQLLIGCDRRLIPLFERSFPGSIVGRYVDFKSDGTRHRHFPWLEETDGADLSIETGSLPKYLRPSVESFPDRRGYLTPDPDRVEFWRSRLSELGDGPKVGICWRSGTLNAERKIEYTDIEMWGPVFKASDASFINLQYDECAEEVAEAKAKFGVTIHEWDDLDLRNDLDDITALVRALDLVITPPTTPGMTAVSTGTEWWCLVRIPPWWCFGGETTPLHPGASIFQIADGKDWPDLMATVAEQLRSFEPGKTA